ncbi:MAG: DUF2283 domain-containing protein [Elusimicrobia bacterium]|nr:DUF2283 domain-containing protein [Elusimicrobiota bacterium]
MAKKIRFSYDKEGDILDISIGEPRKAISREIKDDLFIRVDVKSKEIVGFSMLNFERSFRKSGESKTIPVSAKFALASR